MVRVFYILLAISLVAGAAGVSQAEIYKYVDKNGVLYFTDTPPPGTIPSSKKAKKAIATLPPLAIEDTTPRYAKQGTRKNTYQGIIADKADKYKLDASLIKAVITAESNFNPRAVSRKGAKGLMQLMPSTARELGVQNPFNPEQNIEGGTKYLKYLLGKFDGNLKLALAAYNAGPNRVQKAGAVPAIKETRGYVKKVMALYNGKYASPVVAATVKSAAIYRLILDDGSVLFTNTKAPPLNKTLRF